MRHLSVGILTLGLAVLLSACGGGGGSSGAKETAPTYSVGGTVTGNTGAVVLQDNGGADLTTSGASFSFPSSRASGAAYNVTVLTAPVGQTCSVTNGAGTISVADVSNVVVTCTTPANITATTGSTAFAVFSTARSRIAFVPVAAGVLPIALSSLSASTPANSSAPKKLAAASLTLALIPLTLDGNAPDACSVDSAAQKAVCINLNTTTIGILDLSTFASSGNSSDIVVHQVVLSDLPNSGTSFSGDFCINCGVVAIPHASNPALGQFIVAGAGGYYVYNYPTAGVTSTTAAANYNIPISENLAVDPARNWIVAPGYESKSGDRALNIIDLNQGKVFAWSQSTDSCLGETVTTQQTLCSRFADEEVDSAAIDISTGVLTLQSESGQETLQVDMGQAVFGVTTFTAPHQFADAQTNSVGSPEMSGVLASGSGHYLFIASEFESHGWVGGAALPSASGSMGNFPASYAFSPIYIDLTAALSGETGAACTTFTGGNDPHREATTLSVAGKQYGIYESGDGTCLAIVDMAALLAAPHTVDPTQVDSSYNLVTQGVVQFIAIP